MSELKVEDTGDFRATLFGVVTAVGVLMVVVFPWLADVSLPIATVIYFVGAAVYILGLDQFIAQLSMSKTPLVAYLNGPDPDRIPRWVYFGLVVGSLASAGCLIFAYYGFAEPKTISGGFDGAVSVVLFALGGGVIRYPMSFLWAYWRAA